MKYIQSIEDSKMWKDQFDDNIKGRSKMRGDYYVMNQSGRGETSNIIPSVAGDIIRAKARIRRYKRSTPTKKGHSRKKRSPLRKGGIRKVRKKKKVIRRKTRKIKKRKK